MFPGFLTLVVNNFSFKSHQLLFSHASAEVRGENAPERKFPTTEDQTHNHRVISPTHSPLNHPGDARNILGPRSDFHSGFILFDIDLQSLIDKSKAATVFRNGIYYHKRHESVIVRDRKFSLEKRMVENGLVAYLLEHFPS